jgi:two-component system, chemotaxis family, chemotaxis protein CheY
VRILLVEDDYASRRLMQKYLDPYGEVDVAVDGLEAVNAFRIAINDLEPYDLVFMDIMLPEMDGQEALKHIREIEKEKNDKEKENVKVIMATALGDPGNVVKAYNEGGADSYLVKPVERDRMLEEMRKLGFRV